MAENAAQAAAGQRGEDYPSARRAWYSVAVLHAVFALSYLDWQILAFLAEPLSARLEITDFQLSLVGSLTFVVVFGLLVVPLGQLADAGNRRNIVALGAGLLGLGAVLCGRTNAVIVFVLARLGVAAGHAALAPASVSMIADSFAPQKRGLATGGYAAAVYGGLGLAQLGGAAVVAAAAALMPFSVPVVGRIVGWQLPFLIIAVSAFVLCSLIFCLREPGRRPPAAVPMQLRATLAFVRADWFVFTSLIVGAGLSAIGLFGLFAWAPTLFSRVYGWSSGEIGLVLGVLTLVLGTAGLLVSGAYAGEFVRRGADVVYQRLMMLAVACAIVPGAFSMTADSAFTAWVCIGAVIFFLGMPFGLAQSAIVAIVPNRMRARLLAVLLLVFNLFGLVLGPAIVAFMTDFVFADDAAVGRSIGVVIVVSGVASVLLLALGVKQYELMGRRANE